MSKEKPPDPPDPQNPNDNKNINWACNEDDETMGSQSQDMFTIFSVGSVPFSTFDEVESLVNRKRSINTIESIPAKHFRKQLERQQYSPIDKPPYIVHVSKKEWDQSSGTSLHQIKFGQFLMTNNFKNILQDGVKKIGRNRVSVEFKTPDDANTFVSNPILLKHNYETSISTFNVICMGVVKEVPVDGTDEEVVMNS